MKCTNGLTNTCCVLTLLLAGLLARDGGAVLTRATR